MKIPISFLGPSTLACLVLMGCQSVQPPAHQVAEARPAPDPLPAWTTAKGNSVINGRQVKFATKIIEVTRLEGEGFPAKRYEKKMNAAELQQFLRSMSQTKGVDLMTAPMVTTREGQSASLSIGREFLYPEKEGDSSPMKGEFLGVSNYVRARPAADGRRLKVDVLAEVRQLEGFEEDQSGFPQPIFLTRRLGSSLELASGESVVIGGGVNVGYLEVEDRVPVLGDIPLLGLAFRKRETIKIWRELIVVVTPTVMKN